MSDTACAALIARMDVWLAAHRPEFHAALQPGVDAAARHAFESRFAVTLPPAFRALYQWRNRQPPNTLDSFQDNRMLSSLDAVADAKDMLDDTIGTDFDDPAHWRRGWLPFLFNGGGSHLCLDLVAEQGGTPGQLVAFWKADRDRPVEHASLEAWLLDLVTSMENGTLVLA